MWATDAHATHVEPHVQTVLDVRRGHGLLHDRDELGVVERLDRVVLNHRPGGVVGVVDDLDGVVQDERVGDFVVPMGWEPCQRWVGFQWGGRGGGGKEI
jgi:hypothetical protein